MRFLLILPAIIGIALSQSSGEQVAGQSPQNSPQGTDAIGYNDDTSGAVNVNNFIPQIIPSYKGGDSQDHDYNNINMFGNVPPQSGNRQTGSNFGGFGGGGNPGTGGSSDTVDQATGGGAVGGAVANPGAGANQAYGGNEVGDDDTPNNAAPNAAPLAGGAEVGIMAHHQNYEAASGMSGGAVAGVVAGVVAVGAVGSAVAVMVLKNSASASAPLV